VMVFIVDAAASIADLDPSDGFTLLSAAIIAAAALPRQKWSRREVTGTKSKQRCSSLEFLVEFRGDSLGFEEVGIENEVGLSAGEIRE
jgi:hypothetical protein